MAGTSDNAGAPVSVNPLTWAPQRSDQPSGWVDPLQIDGTHIYANVKTDFES